ncbi:MAG: putative arabinose efflux permease, MFS family [Chloroflexi bacterium AL-W]|nr:putative arabinose efflux permease, MFS family [Chloroflexi bacterium AL-N1]NOK71267.1 putative arabinose efflux permease, MFS family [Chloroflexi bacterium AL-N10]NOK77642.1 putative arabinose efflux permease, MFS family [Chloroflexi bacterium AL-N5]NOK84493.1 putative arabinose efflux permease, MFS family [Chloroflexi bacterium AL-W]NOK92944.1 putative arabinose efflux permease, MFS family [Chloroflexi bacterium AL-N15]
MNSIKHPNIIARAIILSLGAAVALGFVRFNYALLLPTMRTSLEWTYVQAGSMNTANALGYLFGAFIAAPIAGQVGLARTFWISLLFTGMLLFITGLTDNFQVLWTLRLLAGVSSATTFIAGAALASHLASGERSSLVLGLYFGGVGIGVGMAGLGLPQLLEQNADLWRQAWIVMGMVSLGITVIARQVALHIPTATKASIKTERPRFPTALFPALVAYFLFGLGYITYMTFVIAFLRSSGIEVWALSGFWVILGTSSFASAFVWSRLLEQTKGGQALAVVQSVVSLGAVLPLFSTSLSVIFLSAILFGGSFLNVVSVVTNIVRQALPVQAWATGIALFTVIFSLGQMMGPLISGALADRTATLAGGFMLSAGFLFVGAIIALFQKQLRYTE